MSTEPPRRTDKRQSELADTSSSAVWSIVSYVLSGILFWGAVGWLLDRWLFDQATTGRVILAPIGVLVGAGAGGYLGYRRYLHSTST